MQKLNSYSLEEISKQKGAKNAIFFEATDSNMLRQTVIRGSSRSQIYMGLCQPKLLIVGSRIDSANMLRFLFSWEGVWTDLGYGREVNKNYAPISEHSEIAYFFFFFDFFLTPPLCAPCADGVALDAKLGVGDALIGIGVGSGSDIC